MSSDAQSESNKPAAAAGPDLIEAVPLRRPGRWIAATLILVLLALFLYGAATNKNYQWSTYWSYLFDRRISSGAWVTIQLTIWAMLLGVSLGVVLSVMRLSPSPVLKSVAWVYLWLFRGTPVYVQLVFWGLFASIYPHLSLGIPFGHQFATFDIQQLDAAFFFAAIGLGLNEAAYMAEIVRAGISSVGEGQTEAATALGMSWPLTMRRVVLPQAMRVIIPPTGNELISMLKTTSLVTAVPLTIDLYSQARNISGVNFKPVPLLLVASTWYLAITSVLMVGQYYLERHFARGSSRQMTGREARAQAKALAAGTHDGGGGMGA
ncbi:amino acid ABC transporter membrane protein (PAAT family) [Jatrophihabitans sp. GAS493]|uniref:amino acid ABC transporter permease n=1 Tax=Jatrophihabitans sp. GAS493 TaxID=1907575 RepID=UPI000BB677CA|nr:amino acid ABC transporter permease [Jatrophihabitans sp. GAS493]SOD75100.1 amino acid ABC transporter membrane protein (PAAT family) [Jatrophihabitans sp. GAS493]